MQGVTALPLCGAGVRVRKIFYLIFPPSFNAGPSQQMTQMIAIKNPIAVILFRQVSCLPFPLIRLKPEDGRAISVGGIFPDGSKVSELYTGQTATVEKGAVFFPEFENRIAIMRLSE